MTAFNFKARHEKLAIAGFLLRVEDTIGSFSNDDGDGGDDAW